MASEAVVMACDFKHDSREWSEGDAGTHLFKKGVTYEVPADVAKSWIGAGVAFKPGTEPKPQAADDASLNIHNATHESTSTVRR